MCGGVCGVLVFVCVHVVCGVGVLCVHVWVVSVCACGVVVRLVRIIKDTASQSWRVPRCTE